MPMGNIAGGLTRPYPRNKRHLHIKPVKTNKRIKKEVKKMDDDEIFLDPNAGFKLNPGYENYTYHRINRILKQDFNCRLENVWQGYKANRRPGYHEIYNLTRCAK